MDDKERDSVLYHETVHGIHLQNNRSMDRKLKKLNYLFDFDVGSRIRNPEA